MPTESSEARPLREHDLVTTIVDVAIAGMVVPAGSRGVVVLIYRDGAVCEVEFPTLASGTEVFRLRADQLDGASHG